MPTLASSQVLMHLYSDPKTGTKGDKPWATFNGWTSDKVKPRDGGEAEKKFTSWSGVISGPQAEWLARDGRKGSLVLVTGTVRAEVYEKDGKHSAKMEFTRVSEVKVLDAKEDAADTPAPAPARPVAPIGGGSSDSEPPFSRSELEMLP